MEINRRAFMTSLGGASAVALMTQEQKADALEHWVESSFTRRLEEKKYPTMADLEAQHADLDRPVRNGVGFMFRPPRGSDQLRELPEMPAKPTLVDFFECRLGGGTKNHVLQSATRALKEGMKEEIVLACLLHDFVLELIKPDHGWWGAQLFEPYVPEITTFAIRYHQTLRFYVDEEYGYTEYPDLYLRIFGEDYVPEPYLQRTYEYVKNHKWYEHPRNVTVNDIYAFDSDAVVSIDPFIDIIGRHFKQPAEGLGWDDSPSSHMWRTMIMPDRPL